MVGKQFSNYKIVEKLGEGGMGVVYRAQDTKLKREAALKFLPLNALGNKQEKTRFLREAQAAAALSHPNIATVYAIDEENGQSFIAMEYVKGHNLREMVSKGPLKIKKAIDIAVQIANGLQAAHAKGVVHRDIKSENIMITESGQVKIMDFGLAKLSASTMLTKKGTTLGTIAYMSPEQTTGEGVEHRTDIWSLGVVLYEMLTGQLPFKGDYEQAIIYSIVNEEPQPVTALRTGVPVELERIIQKMLAKDPSGRYQNVNEVPVDLKAVDVASTSTSRIAAVPSSAQISTVGAKKKRTVLPWLLAAIFAGIAVLSFFRPWEDRSAFPIHRLLLNTDTDIGFGMSSAVAISPNGDNIVYVGDQDGVTALYLRPLDRFETTRIQGSDGASSPFFSQDGQWVGFYSGGKLKKASIYGGVPTNIMDVAFLSGAAWVDDDSLVIAGKTTEDVAPGLYKVSSNGGDVRTLLRGSGAETERILWPDALPNGRAILFTSLPFGSENPDEGTIKLLSLTDGAVRTVLEGGVYGRYAATGHVVAVWSEGLLSVPFDAKKLEVTGPTVPVLAELFLDKGYLPNYAFSADGILAYVAGGRGSADRSILLIDAGGNSRPAISSRGRYRWPQVAPDGTQLLVSRPGKEGGAAVIYDLSGAGSATELDDIHGRVIWSPDGNSVAHTVPDGKRWHVVVTSLQDSVAEDTVCSFDFAVQLSSWSQKANAIAAFGGAPDSSLDIYLIKPGDDTAPAVFAISEFDERNGAFSPDGAWLAYTSNKTGREEVYVRPVSGNGRAVKISEEGGGWPAWKPDGSQLYFRKADKLMSVTLAYKPEFGAQPARELFSANSRDGFFSLTPSDEQFVMVEGEKQHSVRQVNVVLNWFKELEGSRSGDSKFSGVLP